MVGQLGGLLKFYIVKHSMKLRRLLFSHSCKFKFCRTSQFGGTDDTVSVAQTIWNVMLPSRLLFTNPSFHWWHVGMLVTLINSRWFCSYNCAENDVSMFPRFIPHSTTQSWPTTTHTHTDRPRYDGNNRPHLMLCMAMRPNNASKTFGGRATEDHVVSLKGQYSAPLPNILSLACWRHSVSS